MGRVLGKNIPLLALKFGRTQICRSTENSVDVATLHPAVVLSDFQVSCLVEISIDGKNILLRSIISGNLKKSAFDTKEKVV